MLQLHKPRPCSHTIHMFSNIAQASRESPVIWRMSLQADAFFAVQHDLWRTFIIMLYDIMSKWLLCCSSQLTIWKSSIIHMAYLHQIQIMSKLCRFSIVKSKIIGYYNVSVSIVCLWLHRPRLFGVVACFIYNLFISNQCQCQCRQ